MVKLPLLLGADDFSPADFSNLAVWTDATNPGSFTYSTGSDISAWRDQSGNGNHLVQATSNLQPLKVASGINGRPAVQFYDDSTAKVLVSPYAASMAATTFHGFVVYRRGSSDLGAAEQLQGNYTTSGNQRRQRLIVLSSDANQSTASTVANAGTSGALTSVNCTTTIATDTNAIGEYYYDGANIVSCVNNDVAGQGSTAMADLFQGTASFAVGARSDSGDPFNGYIGEVIFYAKSLSATQRLQVLRYLSGKWGVTIV